MRIIKWLIITLFATAFYACDTETIRGSGDVVSEIRTVGNFVGVEVEDAFEVEIVRGDQPEVEVRADDNLIDRIETTVSGSTLKVGYDGNINIRGSATTEIFITMPTIESIRFDDAIDGALVNFVDLPALHIDVNDASSLSLSGSAEELNAQVNDASNVRGFNFQTNVCKVNLNDASEMDIFCNDRLEGKVEDASTLRYKGDPTVDVSTSDAGRVVDAN